MRNCAHMMEHACAQLEEPLAVAQLDRAVGAEFSGDVQFLPHPRRALGEDNDPVGEEHRLVNVVGYEDDRLGVGLMDAAQLQLQVFARWASSAPNGSSIRSTCEPAASVRAMAMRWRMPPDTLFG